MFRRSVLRFLSVLPALLILGCEDDGPTANEGPFLVVTPLFQGIEPGETLQLTATLGGNPVPVTWQSSNTAVATVSQTGLVTGVAGATQPVAITATMTSTGEMRSSSITVIPVLGTGIQSGVAVTNLSDDEPGNQVLYRIFVPAGSSRLTVQMSGGSGDADLYVRRQTPPTATTFDCRPFLGGNDESCTFDNPAGGSWYIMIETFDPYAGVSLTATVTP